MPAGTPLISMFHRRLLLLGVVMLAGVIVLCIKVGDLSIAKGAELRREAEERLVAWEWVPTSRGRILDRKERVLAQDRPSFDVLVDYRVITGDWAVTQGARAARRAHLKQWLKLSPEQRQELVDEYVPIFQEHLDRAWTLVAQTAAIEPGRLTDRRLEVIRRVDQRSASVFSMRLTRRLRELLKAGEEISASTEEDVRRQIERPIEEQRAPHVLLPRVDDDVGFEFRRLAGQMVELEVPIAGGGTEPRPFPLLPGLTVQSTGDREYPFDTVAVGVDLSTFPGPLASNVNREIGVEGVAYHLLGRVLQGANADRRQGDGSTTMGHRERRRQRLTEDPAFAAWALTPEALTALPRRLDRGEYHDDDLAGQGGIEESQEQVLRGLRGLKVSQLETGQTTEEPPSPGRDVRLTLDVMLQAKVQALMSPQVGLAVSQDWHKNDNPTVPVGTPLNGAAVVLDLDSGEILALVSTPSIPRWALRDNPAAIFEDPWNRAVNLPWIDRAVSWPFPPGSIAKALVLNAAATFGKLNLDVPIDCTGFLYPNQPDKYRCWAFKQYHTTHTAWLGHEPKAPEALMISCNIYFYTLGQRLGSEGIIRTYQMFGLGQPWNLGLGEHESPGFLGTRGPNGFAASASRPGAVSLHDAIQMAIGQGPVGWTPLHAADAFATIGRGGVRMPPRLIASDGTPEVTVLGLNPRAIAESLEGLGLSVNDTRGTGHHLNFEQAEQTLSVPHFNCPGVQVWGKTGTAEAPTVKVEPGEPLYEQGIADPDLREGVRALRKGDHSWFVVLAGHAGENRPRFAIAVMMEYAGSGGKVSGPIVNQIIHALRAEGYL